MTDRFTATNTVGFTAAELIELNRRYVAKLTTCGDPSELIRSDSNPHFFRFMPREFYLALSVLAEFDNAAWRTPERKV